MLEVGRVRGLEWHCLRTDPPHTHYRFLCTVPQTHVVQSFVLLSHFPAHIGKFTFSCLGLDKVLRFC